MVFKIGDNDYSDKILMDTYDVNMVDIYTQWEDGNGTTHRDIYRTKIQGNFEMQISKLSEYADFVNDIRDHRDNGGWISCIVAVNNMNEENVQANLFIDYAPIRTRNNNYTKGYLSFTVTVEER